MALFEKEKRSVPEHIAIIMDGNGRWAKMRGLPRTAGHAAGAESFRRIATYCGEIGVKYLTVYAFSTENWKRSQEEVSGIMKLMGKYLEEGLRDMDKNRVKICFFGDLSRLSPELRALCEEAAARSASYEGVQVNFCLNYGGRDEIRRAVRTIAEKAVEHQLQLDDITEELINDHLDTAGLPDPDLLIRTSGEKRLSNYLPWQLAYTEFYFTDVLWPDFTKEDLLSAIRYYNGSERRFGGV